MARSQAKVFVTIWASDDWRSVSVASQWLYFALLSQSRLNLAGCIDLMPARWAGLAADANLNTVRAALAELEQRRYVAIDQDTGELVIRTFTGHDLATGALNKNLVKGFWSAWEGIISARLRHVVVANLPAELWDRSVGFVPPEAEKLRFEPELELQSEPQLPVDNVEGGQNPTSARLEPQFEPQSEPQFEPSAFRHPSPSSVSTAVRPCSNSTPPPADGADDDDIVQDVAALIADQRIARLASQPTNPIGYRRKVITDIQTELGDRIATLATQRPDLQPAAVALIVEPPAPPKPADPLDRTVAAQRALAKRNAARARGEACPRCAGTGVTEAGDGTYDRCPECQR